MANPKIVDLIKEQESKHDGPFTSIEFFPPRTEEGKKVNAVWTNECMPTFCNHSVRSTLRSLITMLPISFLSSENVLESLRPNGTHVGEQHTFI
jgi:hypothetical protein